MLHESLILAFSPPVDVLIIEERQHIRDLCSLVLHASNLTNTFIFCVLQRSSIFWNNLHFFLFINRADYLAISSQLVWQCCMHLDLCKCCLSGSTLVATMFWEQGRAFWSWAYLQSFIVFALAYCMVINSDCIMGHKFDDVKKTFRLLRVGLMNWRC